MRYHRLPGILTPASAICLGTAGLGSAIPADTAYGLLDAFVAGGGTFIDTAHCYASWLPGGAGRSERTIGSWLRSRGIRHRIIIASKGGHPALDAMEHSRLRPDDLAHDIAESCERLGVDSIDLYYLHRDDPAVPVGEILAALQPHVESGRLGAIAASNWTWQRLQQAADHARLHGLTPFCASQISWSLAAFPPGHRHWGGTLGMDAATLEWHCQSGLPQIPYSSQANGFFAKPLGQALARLPQYASLANERRWASVREIARSMSCSPNAVALAWLLQHPQGGWAIIGPGHQAQLADSLGALEVTLSPARWAALDSAQGPSAVQAD